MTRLVALVPAQRGIKVNLGRWKPSVEEEDAVKRMPKGKLLKKAPLWTSPEYQLVR